MDEADRKEVISASYTVWSQEEGGAEGEKRNERLVKEGEVTDGVEKRRVADEMKRDMMTGEARKWLQMRDVRSFIKREDMRGEDCIGGEKTRGEFSTEKEGGKDSNVKR